MAMRERIHKPKSFQPIPYTNLKTSLLKKQEILPRPEAPQTISKYSITLAEKKELIRLRAIDQYGGQLSEENQARLTYLQTKKANTLMRRFDRSAEEIRIFGKKELIVRSDRKEPIESVQAKLTIGKPNDKYEQEADKIAEQVMNAPQPVQRQDLPEQDEEVRAKPKSYQITPLLQPKLENMAVDDEELMQPKSMLQRQTEMSLEEDEDLMQAKSLVQAQLNDLPLDEEEEMMQAKGNGNRSNADTEDLENKLNNTKGGGSPLPETTKGFMESRFGADFSDVRVHNDSTAASMNQSIQAQAFTQGKDIYFNTGKYSPDSNEGKSLLAHELTHVLQQRGDEIAPKEDRQLIQRDDRGDRSTAREKEFDRQRRRTEGGGRSRTREQGGDFESDWAGRAILYRYLRGGGDWTIDNNPQWSEYMKNNRSLQKILRPRILLLARNLTSASERIDETFHVNIENGEGIIGYQYLHGTNPKAGNFQIVGNVSKIPKENGNTVVVLQLSYTWNDE